MRRSKRRSRGRSAWGSSPTSSCWRTIRTRWMHRRSRTFRSCGRSLAARPSIKAEMRRWLFTLLALATPAVAQGRFAKINAESLYYEVSGSGTPVVLIHGWTLNLRMWDPQVAAFSKRYRVIRYDRRGFGKSSGAEDGTWDALDLKALLDTLGVTGKVHVVGMSQGGRVALQFTRDYPERVASLTLHGTSAPDGFGVPFTGPDRTRFDEWTKLAQDHGLDAFRTEWKRHPLMAIPMNRPAARAQLNAILAAYPGRRLLAPTAPSGPVRPIAMDELVKISVPTLVILGE